MGMSWAQDSDVSGSFAGIVTEANEAAADMLVATCLAAAAQGDVDAYFDLGVAFSTGSHGVNCDLVEAHKWFNLAAVNGHDEAQMCRADIADEMTAREIAEAQRRAREWISATSRKAA
jgi:TPR repeat protein